MKILDGRDIGCWFDISRKRRSTKFFGLHWSGGSDQGTVEEQARRVFDTLVARGDSIHYVCAADGTFVQMCDLDAHAVHIGSARNDDTVGVEFVCPGSSGIQPRAVRPRYVATVHGASVEFYGFTEPQVDAAAEMAQAVLWRYGIAYFSSPVCVADQLDIRAGVIGHFQVADDKADPGPQTMFQVRSAMDDSKIFGGGLWLGVSALVGGLLRRFA